MEQNFISYLRTNINFFSNVERKIARLIIDNPVEFISSTLNGLSDAIGVSQGSIINFSKKFVGGGFPDLKLKIAAATGDSMNKPFDIVSEKDTVKDALHKNITSYKTAFELTHETNNEETLNRAADKIISAKKVEIYGVFRSGTVARDFQYQLLQLGIPATFISDILTCSISAAMLDSNSLVIAVSASGKTKDIIDAVENAKANNVPIISITSNINSPLAMLSDDVLIASASGNSIGNIPTEIRASQILLTDTLSSYIRSKMTYDDKKRFFGLNEILNSHNIGEGKND